jgi:hypothetical protein
MLATSYSNSPCCLRSRPQQEGTSGFPLCMLNLVLEALTPSKQHGVLHSKAAECCVYAACRLWPTGAAQCGWCAGVARVKLLNFEACLSAGVLELRTARPEVKSCQSLVSLLYNGPTTVFSHHTNVSHQGVIVRVGTA